MEKRGLILLHGFLEDASMWEPWIERLEQHFELWIPDLPGHGSAKDVPFPGSLEILAEQLLESVPEWFPIPCTIIGHSMGGYIALAMLDQAPDRIREVLMMQSTALADDDETKQKRDRGIEAAAQNKEVYVGGVLRGLFPPESVMKHESEIKPLIHAAKEMQVPAIQGALKAMRDRPERTELLNTGKIKYLVGREDPILKLRQKMDIRSLPADQVIVLNDVGHMAHIEAPDEAFNAMCSLLSID